MGKGARQKGMIKNVDTGEIQEFQYNPPEYEQGKEVKFNQIESPGSSTPKFEYVGGGAETIRFRVFLFDHSAEKTEEFLDFIDEFTPQKHSQFDPPPQVLLSYGNITGKFIITGISKHVRRLNENLRPVEATVDLQFKEV